MSRKIIVGIIGGTGLDRDSSLLKETKLVAIEETPYGLASDSHAVSGKIDDIPVYIISRHGKNHDVNPSNVNYRANLWALVKQLRCSHILATSACGSLKEEIKPGNIGILDQYLDRTCLRKDRTFYKVIHIEQKQPTNKKLGLMIERALIDNKIDFNKDLCAVTIEGPRFSTSFESKLYKSWGCDVVNMTSVPEVQLAAELGVIYACVMLVTDYDCWKDDEDSVNATLVVERMRDLAVKVRKIIPEIISQIKQFHWDHEMQENDQKVSQSIMVE